MPLIIDGVEIPISAPPDQASFAASGKKLDELQKKSDKQNREFLEAVEKRKKAVHDETERLKAAEAQKQKAIEATTRKLNEQREKMEKLAQIGVQMAAAGGAFLAPFVASAKAYVDNASEAEKTAQRWRSTTDRVTDAQMRLGRVTTSVLNPAYEKLADLLQGSVGVLEKNPQIASGLLRMGGEALAGGTTIALLANAAKQLATMGSLTGNAGFGAAAGALGKVSQVALYATTVILAAEAGLAIGNAINRALGRPETSMKQTLYTPVLGASAILDKALRKEQELALKAGIITQEQYNEAIRKLDAAASKAAQTYDDLGDKTENLNRELQTQAEYEQRLSTLQAKADASAKAAEEAERYKSTRAKIEKDTQEKIVNAQQQYKDKRANIEKEAAEAAQKYAQDSADAQADYQANRAQAIHQARVEEQRAAEDHQERLRQIVRDSDERLQTLTDQRDALGIAREKHARQKQLDDENQNYAREQRRRRQDAEQRIREMDRDFQIQAARRKREYEYMQKARQAELEAARLVMEALIAELNRAKTAALQSVTPVATNPDYERYRRNNYAGVSSSTSNTNSNTTSNTNVTVRGGALSVKETKKVVNTLTRQSVNKTLGAALGAN